MTETSETRNATRVSGQPAGESREDGFHAAVGKHFPHHNKTAPVVTSITVTQDLPGPHCNLERIRVLAGDQLLWEGPLHNLEGIWYV